MTFGFNTITRTEETAVGCVVPLKEVSVGDTVTQSVLPVVMYHALYRRKIIFDI